VIKFFKSSIGRKYIVGITGIALILFVIIHMLGNLQVFIGPKAINDYAALLKSMPVVLWGARLGLIVVFVVHLSFALKLYFENRAARPQPYAVNDTVQATLSSRIMALSGTIILFYVVGHLLHFTLGVILPEYYELKDAQGRHDVYTMILKGFQLPYISIFYIVAMLLLWSHLSHGITSVFQSLGFKASGAKRSFANLGPVLSTIIIAGYISVPLSILLGFVK
jgi:succinate dehydrogenase / fumarate reductase cytochrome b subunit